MTLPEGISSSEASRGLDVAPDRKKQGLFDLYWIGSIGLPLRSEVTIEVDLIAKVDIKYALKANHR